MNKENFSTGIHDGWDQGLDPIGSLATYLTGIKTVGGEGHMIRDGELVREPLFDYDSASFGYRAARTVGTALGLGLNVLMVGLPQVVELASNAVHYSRWNRQSNTELSSL